MDVGLKNRDLKPEELAERFAKDRLLNIENGLFLVHSAAVKYVSLILAGSQNVDREVLVVASWLHHIGRSNDRADHEIESYELAKSLFQNKTSDFFYTLADCILNYGGSKKPETKEGKILREADKIAFIHPTYLDFIKAEFEREKQPEQFAEFIQKKESVKDVLVLPEGEKLFIEYLRLAKNLI